MRAEGWKEAYQVIGITPIMLVDKRGREGIDTMMNRENKCKEEIDGCMERWMKKNK